MKTLSRARRLDSRVPALVTLIAMLSGCASLSGFDGNSSFSCKAPDGVLCESMSGVYANALQNNLPGQNVKHGSDMSLSAETAHGNEDLVLTQPISSGTPIRSAPRVLRIWLAPWEDSDGDLHDQSYLYLTVDFGHWLVEHQRHRIQEKYKPVMAQDIPQFIAPEISLVKFSLKDETEQLNTAIGVVQSKPTEREAAAMMGDIRTPGQPGSNDR